MIVPENDRSDASAPVETSSTAIDPGCSVCHAPLEEDHRAGCTAVLAVCGTCRAPVIRVSTRPPAGTETSRCDRCGHTFRVTESLTLRAVAGAIR